MIYTSFSLRGPIIVIPVHDIPSWTRPLLWVSAETSTVVDFTHLPHNMLPIITRELQDSFINLEKEYYEVYVYPIL